MFCVKCGEEKLNARSSTWYENNKDRVKQYRENNKIKIRAYNKTVNLY